MNLWRFPIGLVLAAVTAGAAAQSITFYEGEGFRGRNFSQEGPIRNFERVGFNDRATSVVVRRGAWELCSDAGFGGNCVTLRPGNYPNLGAMGLSNRISSARPVGGGGYNPPPPPPPRPVYPPPAPPPSGGNSAVTLFDGFGLSGDRFRVDGPIDNLDRTQWNDRARSMIVRRGRWQLCSDAYFRNNCAVFGPGRYDNLGGLAGNASSIRPAR
jgi:hypothetical protein